jgi:subtilisin family serine protease
MASPFVAGVAALVRSHATDLVPEDVARRIVTTAFDIEGDVRVRVDAAAALGLPPDAAVPPVLFLPWLRSDSTP